MAAKPHLTAVGDPFMAPKSPPAPRTYKVASPAEVRIIASKLSGEYLECRDFGHQWRVARIVKVKNCYDRWTFCPRCKTNRRQTLTLDGEILSSKYEYENEYRIRGVGRMLANTRMLLRRESLKRAVKNGTVLKGYK